MRTYASAAYISMILFITRIEYQLHARKVDVQVFGPWTKWRDDEDSPYTGKQILY